MIDDISWVDKTGGHFSDLFNHSCVKHKKKRVKKGYKKMSVCK